MAGGWFQLLRVLGMMIWMDHFLEIGWNYKPERDIDYTIDTFHSSRNGADIGSYRLKTNGLVIISKNGRLFRYYYYSLVLPIGIILSIVITIINRDNNLFRVEVAGDFPFRRLGWWPSAGARRWRWTTHVLLVNTNE